MSANLLRHKGLAHDRDPACSFLASPLSALGVVVVSGFGGRTEIGFRRSQQQLDVKIGPPPSLTPENRRPVGACI